MTFDAKSTGKKRIAAATAHLSGLDRHRKDYKADYSLEVAIGYEGEDDPESAISKEARLQKITIIKAEDLIRLLFLATPKQLGLDKLKNLFDTCYAPLDVKKWVDNLEVEKVEIPPYYDIIDLIYELQSTDNEPPTISVIRYQLNSKLNKMFSMKEIEGYIKILAALVPGSVSIETNTSIIQLTTLMKNRVICIIYNNYNISSRNAYFTN